jgi:trigger factor
MQTEYELLEPTKFKLTLTADSGELEAVKISVVKELSKNVKVPGFRAGKAPAKLVEQQLDQNNLQTEFLNQAVNQLYSQAVSEKRLRPIANPEITITKFVPFSTLEFTAESEAVGEIKLADYKKIKHSPKKAEVTAEEVTKVIDNLRERGAAKVEVKRSAKNGDEVTIDFKGTDAKTKEDIEGAAGQDYPLILGSKNFIPGFEEELIGLKAGDSKSFKISFPADYTATELQNRDVMFDVKATKIQELKPPKLDEAFASTLGPFKSVAELKADIKKELLAEKEQQNLRIFENEILEKIAKKTDIAIPDYLIDEETNRLEEEEKRDLTYRGQTWQEHLDAEGITEEEHRLRNRTAAATRVKAGLILGEIADKEQVKVSPDELKLRIQLLKGQYTDQAMQAELDKPDNQRDILSRMMTEKTLEILRTSATAKA